jgi:mannosyltransferase
MTQPPGRWVERALLVVILLLGWGLALARLGERSLWADEGATAYQALHTPNLTTALALHKEYHALHLVTTMAVVRWSRSEFALRLPSALAAVLALPVVYALGCRLLGQPAGLVAPLLLSISPFVLGYAQEARGYALLEMLACLSLLLLVQALARRRRVWWLGYVVGTTLLLYAHFFAWFPVAAQVLFALGVLLWQTGKRRKLDPRLPWLAASLLIAAVLYLPLVRPLLDFLQQFGSNAGSSQSAVLAPFRLSLGLVRNLVVVYGPRTYGWQEYLFGAGFFLGLASLALRKKWRVLWLILLWFAIPLAVLTAASSSHFFDFRYLIFFVPIFLLVVAEGIAAVALVLVRTGSRRRASRLHVLGAVGLTALLFFPANLPALRTYYAWEKENWREIGTFVHDHLLADEVIYVTPALWAKPLLFYQPALEPQTVTGSATNLAALQRAAARHAGLWYVRYAGALGDPEGKLSAWIAEQGFEMLIDGDACGYGIHVYYRRFDETAPARQADLLHQAAAFCPTDPRFQAQP